MGSRDTVTSDTGTFRFISITPGLYTVTFELAGFATVKRTDIQVGAGFTATLNISMNVASLEEAVTVSGASPVVDTQSTTVTTSFDAAKLAALPNGSNDPWAMLAETPAVKMSRIDVGGSTSGTQTTFTTYGTAGQRPYYEGINGTEFTNANGNYPDMNAFDEVAVNTVGTNAEMGPPGVMMVFVVKSGGNTYHGSGGINYSNGDWQSFNIDADQIARGVEGGGGLNPEDTNRLTLFRDSFAQLGGYIQKDKLWWFGAIRESENQLRQTNFPVKPFKTTLQVYQGKATYQLTQNNKFIGYYQFNSKRQPDRLDRFQLTALTAIHPNDDSQFKQHQGNFISKIEFNSVLSDAMFLEIRAGQWGYRRDFTNETTAPSYEDTTTRIVSGAAQNRFDRPRRNQVIGSLSYYKQGFGGTHNLKVGWEIFRETNTGGCCMAGAYNDVVHILRERRAAGSLPARQPGRVYRGPLEHGPLPDRHVAGQRQAHAEPRRPVRPVQELPLRAEARSGSLLPGDGGFPGGGQRAQVERGRAALRRQLQPDGRRPHGRQGQLGPLLGQPGHRVVEPERLLAEAPCLGRRERRPPVAAG